MVQLAVKPGLLLLLAIVVLTSGILTHSRLQLEGQVFGRGSFKEVLALLGTWE